MAKIALNCAVVLEIPNLTLSDMSISQPWMTGMGILFNTVLEETCQEIKVVPPSITAQKVEITDR